MTEDDLLKLDFPARAEYVQLGRLAVAGLLRERNFSTDAVADLKLALSEACANSIRHAYNGDDGQVELTFEVSDDRVRVSVCDRGAGFHEDAVDCPQCAGVEGADHLSEGGMGISVIRAVVDEFDLEHLDGGGTVLRFVKLCDA